MAFTVASTALYAHAAPSSYFSGVATATLEAAVSAALGECSRKLAPRVGGPAADWTFTDATGESECTRDVCIVAGSDLALSQGLALPGEGADPQWVARARSVRELWSRMGAPGSRGTTLRSGSSEAEPLYAGLTDATPDVVEGAPRGWSVAAPFEEGLEA